MFSQYHNLTIRNATAGDARILAGWWNDGSVMAHAGFPKGLGTTPEQVAESLAGDSDGSRRRLILEIDHTPVGEMSYRNQGDGVADIGIKICNPAQQEKGYGKKFLSMMIASLFSDHHFRKISLDTNLNNTRAQHVYESLGFKKVRVSLDSWTDQAGELQSVVEYELYQSDFINDAL